MTNRSASRLLSFPPVERRLKLGFVGGGQDALIGRVHANGARLSNRWEIVAGALSSDPARTRASGREWLIAEDRLYDDFKEMALKEAAREDGIDAVAIVTPNYLHAPVARAFLEVGIDVMCDKPLSATLDEAKDICALHAQSGLVFGVTYIYSAHAMVRQARAMVADGILGDVRQVHVEYFQDWMLQLPESLPDRRRWRFDPKRSGPSLTVADIGTHAEHMVRFVSGLPMTHLRADFHVTGEAKAMEDTAFMQFRLAERVPGTLMVSQARAGSQCDLLIRVTGTKATLEWHAEAPELLRFRPLGAPEQSLTRGHGQGVMPQLDKLMRMPRGHPEGLSDAWANLYLEFAVAVEARKAGRKLPDGLIGLPDSHDGLLGMKFIEAAIRSNQSGQWEAIQG